jgi:hypothetical protein
LLRVSTCGHLAPPVAVTHQIVSKLEGILLGGRPPRPRRRAVAAAFDGFDPVLVTIQMDLDVASAAA